MYQVLDNLGTITLFSTSFYYVHYLFFLPVDQYCVRSTLLTVSLMLYSSS